MAKDLKKLSEVSYTEDLEKEVSVRLTEIDVNENANVVAGQRVAKGDEFELVNFDKVRSKTAGDLIPFVFTTNIGKSIGAKNFANIDWSEVLEAGVQAPILGRTAKSVGMFCFWARNNHIKFTVEKIVLGDETTIKNEDETETKYVPRTVTLSASL